MWPASLQTNTVHNDHSVYVRSVIYCISSHRAPLCSTYQISPAKRRIVEGSWSWRKSIGKPLFESTVIYKGILINSSWPNHVMWRQKFWVWMWGGVGWDIVWSLHKLQYAHLFYTCINTRSAVTFPEILPVIVVIAVWSANFEFVNGSFYQRNLHRLLRITSSPVGSVVPRSNVGDACGLHFHLRSYR